MIKKKSCFLSICDEGELHFYLPQSVERSLNTEQKSKRFGEIAL